MRLQILAFVLLLHVNGMQEIDTSAWVGRSVYFVVTDRFARSDGGGTPGCGGKGWCGGTIKGVEEKLGYIQALNIKQWSDTV